MKTTLFYFTGTGNSLYVAKNLAQELGDTNVLSIPKLVNSELDLSSENIGIVLPVYIMGAPLGVCKFLKRLNNLKDKYVFAITTNGGGPGNTTGQIKSILQKNGIELASGFSIKMPDNYTPFGEAMETTKQNELFNRQSERIKEIASAIKNKEKGPYEKNFFLLNIIFSLLYKISSPHIPKMDKKFWVDENCNGCMICKKVCHFNNIDIVDNKPSWKHNCEQCFACLQWCPQISIQHGKSTKGKKRYQNPHITLDEIINQ